MKGDNGLKNFLLGLSVGCLVTVGAVWFSLSPEKEALSQQTIDLEKENQQLQQQVTTLNMTIKANEGKRNSLHQEIEETEKHLLEYQRVVSEVLHGDGEDYAVEIIADDEEETVVYSPGYKEDVPRNTDLQKLYILRILNQLPDVKGSTITLWSSKENAQLYAAGTYPNDGAEGWSGMNAKFATLTKKRDEYYLWHHLSVHESDPVGFGLYAGEEGQ